jgi:hypothetical protein
MPLKPDSRCWGLWYHVIAGAHVKNSPNVTVSAELLAVNAGHRWGGPDPLKAIARTRLSKILSRRNKQPKNKVKKSSSDNPKPPALQTVLASITDKVSVRAHRQISQQATRPSREKSRRGVEPAEP